MTTEKVNRERFLSACEAVAPGLSERDILEQSSCIVFDEKKMMTYNGEICCLQRTLLKRIKGAVQAKPLLELLKSMDEETIEVGEKNGHLTIDGNQKNAGVAMESEIMLPVDKVEAPGKWRKLSEDFSDAINLVRHSAGKDENRFTLTCVHIHPERVEACDNQQASRFMVKTPIRKPSLVRKEAVKYLVDLGVTQISETDSWLHFRNPDGLVLSLCRWTDPYNDLDDVFARSGRKAYLPKGLGDAAQKAEIFTKEDADFNRVKIKIKPRRLTIEGRGSSGFYRESKNVKYRGPELAFLVEPKLIVELTKEHRECQIGKDTLKVVRGPLTFVSVLSSDKKKEPEKKRRKVDPAIERERRRKNAKRSQE